MDQHEEPQLQSAANYYNKNRKRSFLFSRISVFVSMVILIGVLAFNVNTLFNDKTVTESRASEHPNTNSLPKLPKGCDYKPVNNGFEVVCSTPTPTAAPASTITIQLPPLPSACGLQTFEGGNRIICTTGVPIPTKQVTLPANCKASNQPNIASCKEDQQNVLNPLPPLPGGCVYKQVGQNYFVVCQSQG